VPRRYRAAVCEDTALHDAGIRAGLRALTGAVRWAAAKPAYQAACHSCHATCGDCHVSKPPYRPAPPTVLGGLLRGHQFVRTPPMGDTCSGCHGGRVAAEYTGQYEGLPADVHFAKTKMTCTDCRAAAQLHTEGGPAPNRFAVMGRVRPLQDLDPNDSQANGWVVTAPPAPIR